MKHYFINLCLSVGMLIAFVSCDNKPEQEIDMRDKYVGTYSYSTKGSVDVLYGAIKILTVSLDEEGELKISKVGDKDQVIVTGYKDTIQATVSGDKLMLEPFVIDMKNETYSAQVTFGDVQATLNDNVLTWNTEVDVELKYGSYTASGSGPLSMTATKKNN